MLAAFAALAITAAWGQSPPPFVKPPPYVLRTVRAFSSFDEAWKTCGDPIVWMDNHDAHTFIYYQRGSPHFGVGENGHYYCQSEADWAGFKPAPNDQPTSESK
jgi:hypothetical protein